MKLQIVQSFSFFLFFLLTKYQLSLSQLVEVSHSVLQEPPSAGLNISTTTKNLELC